MDCIRTTVAVAAALLVGGAPAAGQTDYRNLDDGRPVFTEDAYVLERYAFELVAPYRFEAGAAGTDAHTVSPELAYGLLPNLQVGIEAPLSALDQSGETRWGLAGLELFALYNFNTESAGLPAFGLRADVQTPVGELAGDVARVTVRVIATRSFGRTRLHLNAARSIGSESGLSPVDAGPRWIYSAAADYSLLRSSLLVVAEAAALRRVSGAPVELNLAAGLRWQWTPTVVLDAGVARRLRREAGPDFALTLGLTHTFALPGLMPSRPSDPGEGTMIPGRSLALALALLGASVHAVPAHAQDQRDEQFYYPGSFNWEFLGRYPDAARLFNAFDYGHAVLYELLYTRTGEPRRRALEREYRYLTTDLLVRPPRFAIAEEAVMPSYARLAWRAKEMFDWAHLLHRQIYDVYADERIPEAAKDSVVERVTDYYLSRTEYAFTPAPKSMALMDEQYFSQVFRREEPTFNGLIWAYHWLQVGLYEPLLVYRTAEERKRGIAAAVARFRAMVADPAKSPRVMPMTAAVAPEFARRHPRAAVIFDNLHMMHDIISDVLASDAVPRERKRAVIYQQLAELRNGTRNVMTAEEWRDMAHHMGGVDAMGGPAVPPH